LGLARVGPLAACPHTLADTCAAVSERGGAGGRQRATLGCGQDGGWRLPIERAWWRMSLQPDDADTASSGERLF